ncbi:MAG: isocitrate lyase/PEP mutase family protein [bacterium]
MMDAAKMLRTLLDRPGILVAPGCYDGITAKLVHRAGFEVAYMTGFGTAASVLGMPDAGLISFSEMATNAGNLAEAIPIPLIADGDNGYGNAVNVYRTVKAYARAGVAGLHLEDQLSPKKCGHVEGKLLISREEMVGKIHAAADARAEKDIVIIARTDARAVSGLDDALGRAQAYHEAGADMIFFEAPEGMEEIELVAKTVKAPQLINLAMTDKTPFVPISQLEALGFKLVILPVLLMAAAVAGATEALERLKNHPEHDPHGSGVTFEDIKNLVGFPEYFEMEEKYRA